MKIIDKKEYSYPTQKTSQWKKETFQPLLDLKLKIELDDKNIIECAFFHLIMDGRKENHACLSTQAGCKFGCRFCTSGKKGFKRNLSKEEIMNQLKLLSKEVNINKFDCIVFMGTGEPLDNYDNVISCIKRLIKEKKIYSGKRMIALSTVGIPKTLDMLSKEKLPIDLWVSLHAVFDYKRNKIMPIANKYLVSETIKAAENYFKKTGRFVWINYMLFLGFNNTEKDAKKIAGLLKNKASVFKIILTEPNNNMDDFQKSDYDGLIKFESSLKKFGVKNEIVRFMTAGKDVGAGCGEFIFIPNRN